MEVCISQQQPGNNIPVFGFGEKCAPVAYLLAPVHLVYNDEATSEVYLSAALRSASPSLVERRIRLPNVTSSGGTPLCKTLLLLDCQFCWQAEAVTRKSDAPVHIFFQEILVLPITAVVKLCHFPDHNGCF